MTNYIGQAPGSQSKKYFYGLSRTNDGELSFAKVDFEGGFGEQIELNDLTLRGNQEAQYEFGGFSTDYFDGRDANHALVNKSLKYEQYKFRQEDLYYFIDPTDGHLVVRINDEYSYPNVQNTPPQVTVTVGTDTVASQATGVFYVNGRERPELNFVKGRTYIIDQSGSTNATYGGLNHPLMLSETLDGALAGGGHYNSGVVFKLNGSQVTMSQYVSGFVAATDRKVEVTLGATAPSTLYYWCHFHTGQGNKINVSE